MVNYGEGKNQILKVELVNDKVEISIGIDVLAFATEYGCEVNIGGGFTVTDKEGFAKNIVSQLNDEAEDGTTLVHRMFDKAAMEVLEWTDEFITYEDQHNVDS